MQIFGDISNYKNDKNWLNIIAALFVVEVFIIYIYNYLPVLRKWYSNFGIIAVIADMTIILIGFIITRYLYTIFIKPKFGFNIWIFILLLLVVQITHDLLYYLIVISVPIGKNKIIDFMKEYVNTVSYKAILGDSFMMISTGLLASILSNFESYYSISFIILSSYIITYLI